MSKYISLAKRSESIGIAVPDKVKDDVYYPSVYLNDTDDLGLDDEDLDEEIEATVKLKVRRITKTTENGKTRHSVDFDLMGIKFNDE